jgi:hypothetical protein
MPDTQEEVDGAVDKHRNRDQLEDDTGDHGVSA